MELTPMDRVFIDSSLQESSHPIEKKVNADGRKSWQRQDNEDRSLAYKKFIANQYTGSGYFLDVDQIKWKTINGIPTPVAVIELTRCDSVDVPVEKYFKAIEERWFTRDVQGKVMTQLGKALNVPVYLAVFNMDVAWINVYSLRRKEWKLFTPDAWLLFLSSL